MYFNIWSVIREWYYLTGISRCGLVGGGVALLEEVCLWGGPWVFKCSIQAHCLSLSLLTVDLDIELWVPTPVPCLPAWHHALHHNDNGLNLYKCKQVLIKCFPL